MIFSNSIFELSYLEHTHIYKQNAWCNNTQVSIRLSSDNPRLHGKYVVTHLRVPKNTVSQILTQVQHVVDLMVLKL